MDVCFRVFAGWPDPVKGMLVFLVSLVVATQVNRAVYGLAWNRRPISPWGPVEGDLPARRPTDWLPILGWWGLRRESAWHGNAHWVRPLLVELFFPFFLTLIYFWELDGGLFLAGGFGDVIIHQQFLLHAILLSWILVATLIDLDEKTIPDEVTISGTALALIYVAVLPQSVLPTRTGWLHVASPLEWPETLAGPRGITVGLGALAFWCAAMLTPRRLWLKRGWWRALRFLFAGTLRNPFWMWIAAIFVLGTTGILWVWSRGGTAWQSLCSSLLGLAFGTGLVWAVRVVASRALRKEALGFGDVTLMAMMGAFLGWQPAMFVFFLAPFAAVVVAVGQLIVTRDHEIPYGPYLSLAAVGVLCTWPRLWDRWGLVFQLGWAIPAVLAVCLVLMGALLVAWRRWRENGEEDA